MKKQRTEDPNANQGASIRTCETCHRDISKEIYVKCARCPGFNQCLECFSVGNEAKTHLKSHPFIVLEPTLPPVFQEGWTAEEEILLLSAIQTCGLGNWHEISEIIKTKDHIECECHYFNTFIESPVCPEPVNKIIPKSKLPPPPEYDTAPRESRPSISHEKNMQERNKKDKTTPAEFAGWMPRRLEFEVEYLNDAEQLISGISFSENEETEGTLDQKLTNLRIYNEQLEERHIKTHFAMEWGILDAEFRSFGGKTKQEREMEEMVMPLAQVLSHDELTNFVKSVENEMRVGNQIETYKKWRKNGIVSRDEGNLFNTLESLSNEDKLSAAAVEKWNRDILAYAESPEFRATMDRQLLSHSENQLCQSLGLSPHSYLYIKDIIVREFMVRGEMSSEIASSFLPDHASVMKSIYEFLNSAGLFQTIADYQPEKDMKPPKVESEEEEAGQKVEPEEDEKPSDNAETESEIVETNEEEVKAE